MTEQMSVEEFKAAQRQGGGSRQKILSRGRTKKRGEPNKTESEYMKWLDTLVALGEVVAHWFEPFSLRLSHPPTGQPARYTPDFMILMRDGTTYIDDTKGTGLEDSAGVVRMKCAAEHFPLWIFRKVKKQKEGGWEITEL